MSDFLREVVEKGLNAPSGERICTCHNPNAVKEGLETPCWYCELHAALASRPVEAKADAGDRALLAEAREGGKPLPPHLCPNKHGAEHEMELVWYCETCGKRESADDRCCYHGEGVRAALARVEGEKK